MICIVILLACLLESTQLIIDTLKYDDGIPEGFYIVGEYKNDKLGVKFLLPYQHYKLRGVLVFADNPDGFKCASLCPDNGGPDTVNPLIELDSVYSDRKKWCFTPIELEINNPSPIWFVLRIADYPGVGGDTNNASGNSWYYSDNYGWKQANYNWLIRLIIQQEPGYYEDFASSSAGYTGNWEFGVPSLIPPPKDNCFGTSLNDYYPNNTYLWLESPWIFVSSYGLSQPTLVFMHFYGTERKYDGGNVKISKDGVNWELITPIRGYDVDTISGAAGIDGEPGFSGTSGGWRKDYFFLPIWDSLKIKWCFGADIVGTDYGWFVDEVKIGAVPLHDVSPISINFSKIVPPNTTLMPSTKVKNLGIYGEGTFPVKCIIESCGVYIYENIQLISYIAPDSTVEVNFKLWNTASEGIIYTIKTYTEMRGDQDRFNDTIISEVLTFLLRDSITAGFTPTEPVIDGIIDTIEWEYATVVDGADVLGIDSIDRCGSCSLYIMNSAEWLYIGCKATSIKEIKLYLDKTGDGMWSKDSTEGFYWITESSYKFQNMYYHLIYSLPDSLKSISSQGAEFAIPVGDAAYEIMPTESIRGFVQVFTPIGYVGWWPQYVSLGNYNNPSVYAKIKVAGMGVEEKAKFELQNANLEVYPNPFITRTVIRVHGVGLCKTSTWRSHSSSSSHSDGSEESRQVGSASSFELAKRQRMEIYDLAGRLVHSFILPTNPKSLTTVIEWDATHLPAGSYFLVYKYGNIKIVKKLTLLH